MNWVGGDTLPRGKVSPGTRSVPTVSCPRGQDKPGGGGHSTRGKVSPGTRYHVVFCPKGHRGQE